MQNSHIELKENITNNDLLGLLNFYTQDLFQSIFLTGMQHQITQKHIKT